VAQMRFSHDNVNWTSWEAYATSRSYTLPIEDGTKTVYVQFKDNAGLISQSYSDTIVLDMTTPTISIASPINGFEMNSSTIIVTWTGSDETLGLSRYEIRLDNTSWINVGTNTTHTFTGVGEGSHTIDVKATDKAGNTKQDGVSFTVNTSPPFRPNYIEAAAIIATIMIAALGTTVFLIKIRKKS